MKQWHTKALAQLAQVSVRTLHYYDKIGLLQPSVRQYNNYRLYSEADLLKLQQIIALKFFGFKLSQIKQLLFKHDSVKQSLALQSKFLREKAASLQEVSVLLERISHDCSDNKSISWKKIIEIIEVYKMTQQLEDAWVKEIFTPDELKDYVAFETQMKASATRQQKASFEKSWTDLVEIFKNHLHEDPDSELGVQLGKQLMDWVNNLYGKKYAHLRTKKFEEGFSKGKGIEQHGLSPEIVAWMEKAMDAYWKKRIYTILAQVGTLPSSEVFKKWNDVMDEMFGEEEGKKGAVLELALQNNKISQEAKEWLIKTFKS